MLNFILGLFNIKLTKPKLEVSFDKQAIIDRLNRSFSVYRALKDSVSYTISFKAEKEKLKLILSNAKSKIEMHTFDRIDSFVNIYNDSKDIISQEFMIASSAGA